MTETATAVPDDGDLARAHLYRLLARLLARPPDGELFDALRALEVEDGPVGAALAALSVAAAETDPAEAEVAYQTLFIGVGRGELVPYASWYLTGFVAERPLARLRDDMAALGIARADGVSEPEDHIAALCEMMCGLITGSFGIGAGAGGEAAFFRKHLAGWAPRFFDDLAATRNSGFYAAVGTLGARFLEIERMALPRREGGR